MTVLSRASLRYLARHPAQIALSLLGIALGVAVVVGIELASASAKRAFELSSRAVAGTATHVLRSGPAGVPDDVYARLRREPDAPPMAPVVEHTVVLLAKDGRPRRTLEFLGIDPFAEGPFRALPELRGDGAGLAVSLLRERGGVLLAEPTARELSLAPGDTVPLRIDSRVVLARLVGVWVAGDEIARGALESVLLADIATAQELAAVSGAVSRVDLVLPAEAGARSRAEAWLRARLPPRVEIARSSARAESLAGMTAAFETNLRALGLLALFVGVFLVYNTVTFSVVQRRALWASLRTLGVTRREVFRLVCGEALALGALGTALGLALGAALGAGLVGLVARTLNDLYFTVEVTGVRLDGAVLVRGVLLGLGGTLLGAVPPALEATSEAPRTAQMRSTLESRARALVPRLSLGGLAIALVALALLAVTRNSLPASFAALFGLMLAAALLAPAFTLLACELSARALGTHGLGRLAARGVARNLSRSAVAVAALSIAIAASIGTGVMSASFRGTVERWLDFSLVADVYVSAPSPVSSRNDSDLPPGLVERLLARPDVAGATTYRGFETTDARGRTLFGAALDMDERGRSAYAFAAGEAPEVWRRFEAGAAIVSEPFARRFEVGVGDAVALRTDRGLESFPIAGVYFDYTSEGGFVQISRAAYQRSFLDRGVSSLGLFLAPGAGAETTVNALRRDLRPDEVPRIRSNAALRRASLDVFDRTFRITAVLRLLAGVIAFIGTLSALLALQFEREREIGVLRAIGLTPRQVRRLVLTETGLMGAIAGVFALPLGAVLAWVLTEHINTRAFGWSLDLLLPPSIFAQAMGLAVLSALLAGIVPAWRMSRVSPARALRSE